MTGSSGIELSKERAGMKRASSKAMKRIVSLGVSSCLLFSSLMILVSFHSDYVKALSPTWGDAMEMGPGEWRNYSNGAGTEWQLGIPTNVGPNSTHSGVNAWGTNIAGNYSTETLAYLESPAFDLALSTNTELVFWHYLETDVNNTNNWDGGIIEVSTDTGITWIQIDDPVAPNPNPYYDANLDNTRNNPLGGKEAYCYDRSGWEEVSVDLSQFDGSSSFMFRFAFGSDTTGGSPGWYIDDVLITADVKEGVIVEPDYSRIDLAGTIHRFNLTVRNLQKISDVIDIVLEDAYGWPTELYMWDGVSPLADTGGAPGIPDTGSLFKGASRDIILEVTIPPGTPYGVNNLIQVKGVPYSGPAVIDVAYVRLSTPTPDVSVVEFSVPGIQISGEEANVTASIMNNGQYNRSFDVRLDISGPGELQYDPVRNIENLSVDETTNVYWTFTPATTGDYTVEAMTLLDIDVVPGNNVSTRQMTVMTKLFEDTMENGGPASQGKWTAGSQPQTAWELGVPYNVGPSSCHSTTKCWGTNLNSGYRKAADIRLETPTIDLSGSDRAILSFSHFYQILGPWMNDGGFVEVSTDGGSSWTYLEPLGGYSGSVDLSAPTPPGPGADAYAGSSSDWMVAEFDLNPYSGEQIIIGFHLWTDPTNFQSGWAGWYIDDVQILHIPKGPVLIFTEIQDSGQSFELVEVYNSGKVPDHLTHYSISTDGGITTMAGSWSADRIDPGKYAFFTTSGDELNDDGEILYLLNTSSIEMMYQIGYGQRGPVPDPISKESSSRFWNGIEYEEYWTRSASTSFGARNDVRSRNAQTEVVLNEVLFNPSTAGDEFVEIFYSGSGSVNLKNYTLVSDSAHTIGSDVILDAAHDHYIMLPTDYPGLFTEMDSGGENLYLYDSTGSFLDMVGWSSGNEVGKSMARVPEGLGSRDGYDDISSQQGGWRFGSDPTMALIGLRPDQSGYGDLGDVVSYSLTILNQPIDDLITLTYSTGRPWQIDLYTENWSPLPDTNSDGLPDTGQLPASSSYNFNVKVTIPAQPPIGNEMMAEIYASSTVNKARDFATIVTKTRPHLEPMKTADPEEIYLKGVGTNELTEITLEVFGGGYILTDRHPQDTIFVIDSSGSMQDNDPFNLRLDASKRYVDNMSTPDRGAVVDFDHAAFLAPIGNGDHLSNDYTRIKQNIDTIDSNGATDVGLGLKVANEELIANGDPTHLWIEILLTDANQPDTYYPETALQIQNATDAGIIIFSIGLGEWANEPLLREIAERTGGEYYHAEDPTALQVIFSKIEMVIYDIAGRDGDLTDSDRMIRDVLPPYIHLEWGSFSIYPDVIYQTMDGTFLEWEVARIKVGENWKVSYQVRSSQLGWVPVGVYPDARVSYIKWNNQYVIHPFPDVKVHVILPPTDPIVIGPPKDLRTSAEGDTDIFVDWTPPDEPTVSHYLIYRSVDQRDFDFTGPIHDTSNDVNPRRSDWLDTGAADVGAPREYYYVVRAVDNGGSVSNTSNTAGKWTRTFEAGLNAFSLPLEPYHSQNVSELGNAIPNAEFIRRIRSDGGWDTHIVGTKGVIADEEALVGKGYEISVSAQSSYTFVGFPGSMISFHEGFGDDVGFRKSLVADVQGSDITITWQSLSGASEHEVYRSASRDGLFNEMLQSIATVPASLNYYVDSGVVLSGLEYYYWVVPIDSVGKKGSSTYSIGVWIGIYQKGSDTISSPLKLMIPISIDELCDMNEDVVGIAYLINGVWKFHSREMPASVYNSVFLQGQGFQISNENDVQLVFIGY